MPLPTTAPLCLFHRNCLDGRAAAAIVRKKVGPIECRGVSYGHDAPDVRGRKTVYIVDFGYDEDVMRRIQRDADEVVWIDHHATHADTAERLGWGHFDQNESGASLTWKVLFPDEEPPPVVAYVRDRDLWRWELPDSRAITTGLYALTDDRKVDDLLSADLDEMRTIGQILLDEQNQRVKKACKNGIPSSDPYGQMGKRALVVNATNDLSEIGGIVCSPEHEGGRGYDLCICYYQRGDGRYTHSLRAAGNVDCAAIASARGGGGHPNAAAYVSEEAFPRSVDCLDWQYP